jgi:hypothetical protein
MGSSDIEKTMDVLKRVDQPSKTKDLKDRLYTLLFNSTEETDTYNTVADTLALISAIEQIAAGKGTKRDKGIDVLGLLELTNAKPRYVSERDRFCCQYAACLEISGRSLGAIRDELSYVMGTHPVEVSKIWADGKQGALIEMGVLLQSFKKNTDKKVFINDLKYVVQEMSEKIRNS